MMTRIWAARWLVMRSLLTGMISAGAWPEASASWNVSVSAMPVNGA